jgi:hypothetical protein
VKSSRRLSADRLDKTESRSSRLHLLLSMSLIALLTSFNLPTLAGQKTASALPTQSQTQTPSETGSPADQEMTIEVNNGASPEQRRTNVYFDLDIPHPLDYRASCNCMAYPYPVALQRKVQRQAQLTTNNRMLTRNITATAYNSRLIKHEYYPIGGWRWQEAYQRALKDCGATTPIVIGSLYLFVNKIFPYAKEESLKTNEFEEKRSKRYQEAAKDYTENHADAEAEATKKGLTPTGIRFNRFGEHGQRRAEIKLAPGQWWIVCRLKIPGLTYYWQEPVTVHADTTEHVSLNEDNALLIEGAW